ncbi:MAG: HsdR family type I site-specific deoxyribonuclease [Christensenellaceae bacterium]
MSDFNKESEFEKALINMLFEKGWEKTVLKYKTERDLIKNWANILFENNRDIDRLNDYPLTDGEMSQIIEQITLLRTPLRLNGFINGKTVAITRDNLDDTTHFGKEVSLKIYDRQEIAAGQSRYQIAQQPQFPTKSIANDRRGDLMLLINGMPVIHIELKKSGISVTQACNQIEKYAHEGIFTGLFSLIQIFVAMEPNETLYFANPGPDGKFNKDYYFHWADFNNEPINNWENIVSYLLSIPMAHQLIGFYTVPDDTDGILKVMRSYQYYAASAISDRVAKIRWDEKNIYGGYIWHTTGSGKTMTSFKSAQLIANSNDADKVIFLMDRIELGTQSLLEYRGFSDEGDSVQATENTEILVTKLKSNNPAETLIVTSIQKMSNIKDEGSFNADDILKINKKRIVFIVDEAHRSTFGVMLATIKNTFPNAIFFGFTGTPILDENQKKSNTTATVFGNELHRYSIADGIRDKNVLGFDPYQVLTYKDKDLRRAVGLEMAKAKDEAEAFSDEKKKQIYLDFTTPAITPMAGYYNGLKYIKGIEDYISESQYDRDEHRNEVVKDIIDNWVMLSHNGKYHAIFATSSINEAIEYYRLFMSKTNNINITALFDPNIDNNGNGIFKGDGLVEIITDYNAKYNQNFTVATAGKMKKDIALRLAHKSPYISIENDHSKQIDILIVVDQMLTGFDSKWLNTLYLDKKLESERIIQAFSRTNRLFGPDKPFGTIRYYRKPHTMKKNIEEAFKLYSGDKPFALFADKLENNLNNMNAVFLQIKYVFESAGVQDFEKLPAEQADKAQFAKLFKIFNEYLEASKIQGFVWSKLEYSFSHKGKSNTKIKLLLDENIYMALVLRYKELFAKEPGTLSDDIPYEIDGYLTEINTDTIDTDYMNSRFKKWLKSLGGDSIEIVNQALDALHKTFATLTQEEQKYANIFLHDIQSGNVHIDEHKTLKEYITEYRTAAKNDQIHRFSLQLGVDECKLRDFMKLDITLNNINEFGRFDVLKNSVNKSTARAYFEKKEGNNLPPFKITIMLDELLREFVISGGFDVVQPSI